MPMPRKVSSYNDGQDSGQATEQPSDPSARRPLRRKNEQAVKERAWTLKDGGIPPGMTTLPLRVPQYNRPGEQVKGAKGTVASVENNLKKRKSDEQE